MSAELRRRVAALEACTREQSLRLPTLAEWYAGFDSDGDILPNGEVIRLPRDSVSWTRFYGRTGQEHLR